MSFYSEVQLSNSNRTNKKDTDFAEHDPKNIAWSVIRSEFDELLLRHASASGVKVFEGLQVTDIKFSNERPVSAVYKAQGTEPREIKFDYLVDASGRTGIMSTKYLRNRRFNKSLKNMAFWVYWRGGGRYSPGTETTPLGLKPSLAIETGLAWYIPLHNGTVFVGVVTSKESYDAKKARLASNGEDNPPDTLHRAASTCSWPLAPSWHGELSGEIKSAGDYSYSATQHAGPYYRIAGDAGAFIGPFFSSRVHLAFTGGLSAASTIVASIGGHRTEAEASAFHNTKVGVSYTRFLVVVLGIYKQIRAQSEDVLSDADEDNFDKAFRLLRPDTALIPVIQGAADVDPKLTIEELDETHYFCKHVLALTSPQMRMEVKERVPNLTAPDGAILERLRRL
ncbi:hypothetical protein DXG01_002822 [Tephrocybe rancida]|nr:hypothetical protein DXG01_002822 [Tephrocybe rancida]